MMNRNLVAALFALAILPATAFSAGAADAGRSFAGTASLSCAANASDGESLKVRMMVKNTSGRHIPQGTKITIGIRYQYGNNSSRSSFHRRILNETAWRDVPINGSIGFDHPAGRFKVRSCAATATFAPNLQQKTGKFPRIPR